MEKVLGLAQTPKTKKPQTIAGSGFLVIRWRRGRDFKNTDITN
jgi:hypothetical protein